MPMMRVSATAGTGDSARCARRARERMRPTSIGIWIERKASRRLLRVLPLPLEPVCRLLGRRLPRRPRLSDPPALPDRSSRGDPPPIGLALLAVHLLGVGLAPLPLLAVDLRRVGLALLPLFAILLRGGGPIPFPPDPVQLLARERGARDLLRQRFFACGIFPRPPAPFL